jgi:hypothetical protein
MGRAGPSESRSSAFRLQPMALAMARTVWSPAGCAGANACILAGGPPGTHGRRLIASNHPSGMAWLTAADCSVPRLVRAVRPQGEQALVIVGSQEWRLRRPISGCAGGGCFSQGLQRNASAVGAARRVRSVALIQRRALKSNAHELLAAAVIDKYAAFVNKYRADENGPLP